MRKVFIFALLSALVWGSNQASAKTVEDVAADLNITAEEVDSVNLSDFCYTKVGDNGYEDLLASNQLILLGRPSGHIGEVSVASSKYGVFNVLEYENRAELIKAYQGIIDANGAGCVSLDYKINSNDETKVGVAYADYIPEKDAGYVTGTERLLDSIDNGGLGLNTYIQNHSNEPATVVLIDSCVDTSTYDKLKEKIVASRCKSFITEDGKELAWDAVKGSNHGTMTASILAKNTPDNTRIIVYRALNGNGSSSSLVIYSALEEAMREPDVDVINASVGYDFSSLSESVKSELKIFNSHFQKLLLKDRGICLVKSSGNEGSVLPDYDISYLDGVITVGSAINTESTFNELRPVDANSNYGDSLDFVAFGEDVWCGMDADGLSRYTSGTSLAAPLVSAHFAILKSLDDSMSLDKCMAIYKGMMAKDCKTVGWTERYGWGYADLNQFKVCFCGQDNCHGLWHDGENGNISLVGATEKYTMPYDDYGYVEDIIKATPTPEPTPEVNLYAETEGVSPYSATPTPEVIYVDREVEKIVEVEKEVEKVVEVPVEVEKEVIKTVTVTQKQKAIKKPTFSGATKQRGKNKFKFAIKSPSAQYKYEVVYSRSSTFNNAKYATFSGGSKTVGIDAVGKGKKYKLYYKVRAIKGTQTSKWSKVLSKTIK